MEDSITNMVESKRILETLPNNEQNLMYKNIIIQINNYIDTYCQHNYISDLIDINPDYSQTIQYCEKCYKTI